MSTTLFGAALEVDGTPFKVTNCTIREGYNAGWSCEVSKRTPDREKTVSSLANQLAEDGIEAGKKSTLLLGTMDSQDVLTSFRRWPCMIDNIRVINQSTKSTRAEYQLHLVDPITYMAGNSIWGAYRLTSLAEIIGGVLSLAGGGSGEPTLNPILNGMPKIKISHSYRNSLDSIPYMIAAGETLEEWLDHVAGQLGIRFEMLGMMTDEGEILKLMIYDGEPDTNPENVIDMEFSTQKSTTQLFITNYSQRTYYPYRGYVLDDATLGDIYNYGATGAVGRVISEHKIGVDESQRRSQYPTLGSSLESFLMYGESRQMGCRPGRLINFGDSSTDKTKYQLANVVHSLSGSQPDNYDNVLHMLDGGYAWHPMSPPSRSPIVVGATVDSGSNYRRNDPVPRDRLGQIFIRFPFIPTSITSSSDDEIIGFVDANADGQLTLSDFSQFAIDDFTDKNKKAAWDIELANLEKGSYDGTGELDVQKRKDAELYKSYKEAKANDVSDRDNDGVITSRDAAVSNELSSLLKDDDKKAALRKQWEELKRSINTNEFGRQFTVDGHEFYSVNEADAWDEDVAILKGGGYDEALDTDTAPGQIEERKDTLKRYIIYREMAVRKFIESYSNEVKKSLLDTLIEEAHNKREQEIAKTAASFHMQDPVSIATTQNALRGTPGYVRKTPGVIPFRYKLPSSIVNFLVSLDSEDATRPDTMRSQLADFGIPDSAESLLSVAIPDEYSYDFGEGFRLGLRLYAKAGVATPHQVMYNYANTTSEVDSGGLIALLAAAGQGVSVTNDNLYDYDVVQEYGVWFDRDYDDYFTRTQDQKDSIKDAAEKEEKWPPRIPLSIVGPIAGAYHGFIPSHRQGDSCRIAVYSPFSAEIIGFQYRNNQKIGTQNAKVLTGFIIDHNGAYEWSGVLFRKTNDAEVGFAVDVQDDTFFDPLYRTSWLLSGVSTYESHAASEGVEI